MNEEITYHVLQAAIDCGVREIIICAGSRNSSFVEILRLEKRLTITYLPEERSAAFFALGRSRQTGLPVAVIVTSGTAAGELLPAAMEAYYLNVPLMFITADRPSSFRGSGAPQAAEQALLFGVYARFFKDIEDVTPLDLSNWDKLGVAHLNVCLSEPQKQAPFSGRLLEIPNLKKNNDHSTENTECLDDFLNKVKHPIVIVSALSYETHFVVVPFLKNLGVPIFLEGVSGLREHKELQHLRIHRTGQIIESALKANYEIDGVLRIGGVPTHRIWRDLEYLNVSMKVYSISDAPFSGLSWNRSIIPKKIIPTLKNYKLPCSFHHIKQNFAYWMESERAFETSLQELFKKFPSSEPSLIYYLSKLIPEHSHVYLGNSLPIREWDIAATTEPKDFHLTASRGLCGIDGQISTFLGLCEQKCDNWAILGDLTTIYDMAGFFVLPQLNLDKVTIVVVNNGGGKIFERMFPWQEMLNAHNLSFDGLAKMWNLDYSLMRTIPKVHKCNSSQLIEIVPDSLQTKQFHCELNHLMLTLT